MLYAMLAHLPTAAEQPRGASSRGAAVAHHAAATRGEDGDEQ